MLLFLLNFLDYITVPKVPKSVWLVGEGFLNTRNTVESITAELKSLLK